MDTIVYFHFHLRCCITKWFCEFISMEKEMPDNFAQWRIEFTFPEKGIRETVSLGKKRIFSIT